LKDSELDEIRQLIDMMQSSLVEMFEQLRELREKLHVVSGLPLDSSPSIVPLFSEIKLKSENNNTEPNPESAEDILVTASKVDTFSSSTSEPDSQETADSIDAEEPIPESVNGNSASARVSRVLDPVAHELRTGEATADIILEYLQAAKDYLIDDDEQKKKVGRDMDIVLNFLKARGKRGIRTEERDNILKRIRRWKVHLVSHLDSPAM